MKIAAWNVNSIKSRLSHMTRWLIERQPDIVLLQELKCEESGFPHLEFSGAGYNAYMVGQKTYNGVGILSKHPLKILSTRLPGDEADAQARYIEAESEDGKWRFASVYVPNGQEVGSEKYAYKMKFLERLHRHLRTVRQAEKRFVIGGDFNIAFEDIDVHDPAAWRGQILFSDAERAALYKILHLGLTDCWRARNRTKQEFTWWDYRAMNFERNAGLRIDYLFASPEAADLLRDSHIDRDPRGWEKASDHTPVVAEFAA